MNVKIGLLAIVPGLLALALPAHAQESVRDLRGPGRYDKFLTNGQLDRWVFDGEKGETIIAHVASREFDPILELSRTEKTDDKVLLEVDDPGNESRFSVRLPDKGQYKIRIHAYKYQGGGNYSLQVQRFQATPLVVGKPLIGTFDSEGRSYHYFPVVKDQILIPDLKGASPNDWKMLDFKGREMPNWAGSVLIADVGDKGDTGECSLIVTGSPEARYDLQVREATRREVVAGKKDLTGTLGQGELDALAFAGKPGDFRVFEVEKKGELLSRLVYAPLEKETDKRLARPGERAEITFLPVASRGGRLRYAAVLGRAGRYQVQLLAETPAGYKVSLSDPSVPLAVGKETAGNLPVGGAGFFSFKAVPGQLFQSSLTSPKFVPLLRLYDGHGSLVAESGEGGEALEARITHMVVKAGTYRLLVSSLGDGGGGDFRLDLQETKLKELQIGGRGLGTVQVGATDFWAFPGQKGQTVFLNVRSSAIHPAVSVRSPDGVVLAADNRGNAQTGSLFALRLPKSGRYTIWVSSQRGAGDYSVRLIDGD